MPHHHGSPQPHHHDGPHHPPHLRWDFPAPSLDDLVEALGGDRELAYAAMLALESCPPEMRVLAHLLLRRRAGEHPESAAVSG